MISRWAARAEPAREINNHRSLEFMCRADFHSETIIQTDSWVWEQPWCLAAGHPAVRNEPRSDGQSVHSRSANKAAGRLLAILPVIPTHCWDEPTPSSACWKSSTKTKTRKGGNEKMWMWVQASVYLSKTAFVFYLAQFFFLSQTCVWHLHARLAEPPAEMKISQVLCHVSKSFISCSRAANCPNYWTNTDISISGTCEGAYGAICDQTRYYEQYFNVIYA